MNKCGIGGNEWMHKMNPLFVIGVRQWVCLYDIGSIVITFKVLKLEEKS